MTVRAPVHGWDSVPVALLRLDADGRVLDANAAFATWVGADAETARGRQLGDLLTAGGRIYWETHVAPVVALQGRVEEVALELRTPAGVLPVLLSAAARPADDPGLDVALCPARERSRFEHELVAARAAAERSAARLRWVQEATAALSRAVAPGGVAEALVQAVARNPAVASADLWRPRDRSGSDRVSAGRRPPVPEPGPPSWDAGHDGVRLEQDGRLVVPVVGDARRHGLLVVTPHDRPGDEPVDPDALSTIARHGAVALDRAVLHEQSVSVAHELQHAMLTEQLPARADLEVHAEYRPAVRGLEVGGDWYDAFGVEDTTVAAAVGDVVGHGLHAATAMGQLRTATRALARPGLGPAGLLALVDDFVVRREVGFAATLVYCELDTRTATLTFACAGHLPPLLVRADGSAAYLWDGRSAPLGVHRGRGPRPEGAVRLEAGDVVLLYTDGVVERRDGSLPDGLERLSRAAERWRHDRDGDLIGHIVDARANGRDDACVLRLTWHGPGAPLQAPAPRG